MKPLFIPLKSEFYEAFERGDKHSELRLYGPRWNEKTCPAGRPVILSKGYGKQNRLQGVVIEFLKRDAKTFGSTYRVSVERLYGTLEKPIADIRIKLINQPSRASDNV